MIVPATGEPPSMTKFTPPVGFAVLPVEVFVTNAVKVTFCWKTDGFTEERTWVEVSAGVTVWPPESVPLLSKKFPSELV